ncbi:ribonuclease H2 subunit A [Achlya hypogyna]|uniref:Ribonuclease H2 subunit A n=1 Tax=Achlya hypogyna TaxID=1202772 RepID=A0A1V9YUC2_ACHHY|nr:ribonuclease H2 subunit A [Achlya hypogyna]
MGLEGLVCIATTCFGEASSDGLRYGDRNACPQRFKLKTLHVHVDSPTPCRLRLESTNCKLACLPAGLIKKILFLYLRGRQTLVPQVPSTPTPTDSTSIFASPPATNESAIPMLSSDMISIASSSSISSETSVSMNEAYAYARGCQLAETEDFSEASGVSSASSISAPALHLDLNILQDTYAITFRKAAGTKDREEAEIKLFMVNAQRESAEQMKIVHVLLRDNLWVDVVVSDELATTKGVPSIDHDALLQLDACPSCGLAACCTCDDPPMAPQTIWRREEDVRLDEVVVKRVTSPPGYSGWTHTCTATCEEMVPSLQLRLVPASAAIPTEFELAIASSKKVQDLSDAIYTMYCISVCHGELKWHVTRRYRDFCQMHTHLAAELKMVLPTLPPKTWLPSVDEAFVLERQAALETYLRQLLPMPGVMESPKFLSFLGALSTTWFEHERLTGVPRDVVHVRILHRFVSVGDILLFRSKNSMSGVQRSMTGAEWDHVGMVIALQNKWMLLEATGDGVTIFPLVPRILAYTSCFTNYIALRKLQLPPAVDRDEFTDKLAAFASQVDGKPYVMTLGKLVKQEETNAALSGFFCSELIAAALKHIGLLDTDLAASNFWPGCFASGGQVDKALAARGAGLDPEVVIDCRVLEIAMTSRTGTTGTVIHSASRR